jgi:hypothetical protein
MSANYSSIPVPNFECGNMQDLINTLKANLIKETTDVTNSNFLIVNGSTAQDINRPLNINWTGDDADDTDARIAKKKFVRTKIANLLSGSNTFTGVNVFGTIRSTNNSISNANDLVTKEYGDANYKDGLSLSVPHTWTATQTFPDNSITLAKINNNSNIAMKTASLVDFQNNVTCLGLQAYTGILCDTGSYLTVNGTINLLDNAMTISKTSGLQTALNAKQDILTTSTDISIRNITTNNIIENYQLVSTASGTSYTLDYSNGYVFYLSNAPTGNFTVQINNLVNASSKSSVVTLIYNANYIPTTILMFSGNGTSQITLSSSTPLWKNQITPTVSSSNVVVVKFSLLKMFASNYCCADLIYY